MTSPFSTRLRYALVLAVVALALNLRPSLASVGPLLDLIAFTTGINHVEASLLTTLPVALMGVFALASAGLQRHDRTRPAIAVGVALIGVASCVRFVFDSRLVLFVSAMILGVGIAIVQTWLPGFIKRVWGVKAGRIMGLYTTGIMAGAACGAAAAAPLATRFGWPNALGLCAIPAALAFSLWLVSTRRIDPLVRLPQHAIQQSREPSGSHGAPKPWRAFRSWELMVFFGIGTGGYTLVLAWLAPFYVNLGWSRSDAGDLLAAVTIIEVVAGIGVSLCINRIVDRRKPLLLVLVSLVCGLLCLAIAPERQFVLATGLLGLGIGALFPLSLILTLDHASTPRQAGELSGFVQGGGYLIASLAPLGAGVLRDRIADMSNAWMAMAAAVTCLMLLCIRFNPASYGSVYGCGSTSRKSIAAN